MCFQSQIRLARGLQSQLGEQSSAVHQVEDWRESILIRGWQDLKESSVIGIIGVAVACAQRCTESQPRAAFSFPLMPKLSGQSEGTMLKSSPIAKLPCSPSQKIGLTLVIRQCP
jgi:hypothetical protein